MTTPPVKRWVSPHPDMGCTFTCPPNVERVEIVLASDYAALEARCGELGDALASMLILFGKPRQEEYVDGGATYKLAVQVVTEARAALTREAK